MPGDPPSSFKLGDPDNPFGTSNPIDPSDNTPISDKPPSSPQPAPKVSLTDIAEAPSLFCHCLKIDPKSDDFESRMAGAILYCLSPLLNLPVEITIEERGTGGATGLSVEIEGILGENQVIYP